MGQGNKEDLDLTTKNIIYPSKVPAPPPPPSLSATASPSSFCHDSNCCLETLFDQGQNDLNNRTISTTISPPRPQTPPPPSSSPAVQPTKPILKKPKICFDLDIDLNNLDDDTKYYFLEDSGLSVSVGSNIGEKIQINQSIPFTKIFNERELKQRRMRAHSSNLNNMSSHVSDDNSLNSFHSSSYSSCSTLSCDLVKNNANMLRRTSIGFPINNNNNNNNQLLAVGKPRRFSDSMTGIASQTNNLSLDECPYLVTESKILDTSKTEPEEKIDLKAILSKIKFYFVKS